MRKFNKGSKNTNYLDKNTIGYIRVKYTPKLDESTYSKQLYASFLCHIGILIGLKTILQINYDCSKRVISNFLFKIHNSLFL